MTSNPGRTWHRYLADHGYACLHWPREFGGAAATVTYQAVFAEECARADVPRQLNITGADLVGPVLIKFGSPEQKDRYLEPIRLGDDVWCQLFSEPGAGSDLASVRTRAERTRDGLAHRWPEGVEFGGRLGPLRAAARPNGSGQAPRLVDVRRAHGHPGGHGAAADADGR